MLVDVTFSLGLTAILFIATLSACKFIIPGFEFWPPPNASSWQHRVFRGLFRVFFYSLVALSVLDFQTGSIWRLLTGSVLFGVGFGFAMRWTNRLGWQDAFGDPSTLKTDEPFAWSRNPIYVLSIVGMIGWGVAIGSKPLSILLECWALLYVAAPFLEEPWLEQQFGEEFRAYKARVPRYFRLF